MSQHADISKTILARAVKLNLSLKDTHELLADTLEAAEYEDRFIPSIQDIPIWVKSYILTQKDGLYGVTHEQTNNWLIGNLK